MASIKRSVTKRGEARWIVEYHPVRGRNKTTSRTFKTRREADAFAREVDAVAARGQDIDPAAGRITVKEYADRWLAGRRLAPSTRALYQQVLRSHIIPAFGSVRLDRIRPEDVRIWHRELHDRTPVAAAKAYRTLHAILATAVKDGRLQRHPAEIEGAATEDTAERPLPSWHDVDAILEAAHPRLVPVILLAAYGGLRLRELLAVRVRDFNVEQGTVRVSGALDKTTGQRKATKTSAGARTVALPRFVVDQLGEVRGEHGSDDPDSPLVPGLRGGTMSVGWLQREWSAARKEAGAEQIRLHDLRHLAGTTAAQLGSTVAEVQRRLGHATPRAAMRYQHAASERDAELAAMLDQHRLRRREGLGA